MLVEWGFLGALWDFMEYRDALVRFVLRVVYDRLVVYSARRIHDTTRHGGTVSLDGVRWMGWDG